MSRLPLVLLALFALGFAAAGISVFVVALRIRFEGIAAGAAVLGPLLLAHAIAVLVRREPFDRKVAGALAMTLRVGGAIVMMGGAFALRVDVDMAWPVIATGLVAAGVGVGYQRVLALHGDWFRRAW